MNEPKVPAESKNWEAINIFLFSNGQEYTPPRKYHLLLDELKSWDNVKSYLAQAHYGPQTSTVELYSLEGKIINTPLELTDSTAYVAIKPPEEFIQSGYSQYLIKASRSWEKRQEKILKSEDMTVTVEANIKKKQSKSDMTLGTEYVKVVDDLASADQVFKNGVVNNNKGSTKTHPSTNMTQIRKNNIAIKRQPNKTFTAEKNNNSSKGVESQINSKRKEVSYLKCFKGVTKKPSLLTKNMKVNLKPIHNHKTISQNITNVKKVSKAEIETDLKTILSNQNTTTHKSEIDINFKATDIDTKIVQKNTIYKDQEKLLTAEIDEISSEKPNLLSQQNIIESNGMKNFKKTEGSLSLIEAGIKSSPKLTQTRNQSISVNRGGVIKLKFNIEVRDFQPYSNQNRNDSIKTTQSYIPFIATEKASQVNLNNTNVSDVTLLKYDNGFLKREESLETLFTINRDIFSNNENPKVIIINCSCDQFDADSKSIQMQCEKNNGNLVYLLPGLEKDVNTEICTCDKNYVETKHANQVFTETFSNKNIDRRVSISPEAHQKQEMAKNRKENNDDTTELLRKISNPQQETVKQDVQTQSEDFNPQIQPTDPGAIIVKYDKYTQTEWCNIILEARRQEDGHYALHLPPLHALLRNNF